MSLRAQKDFFAEYAAKNGLELVELYADEGISGTKLKNRQEFKRMMADAQQGRFGCVYVKDVSRLARNVVDFLQSIRKLKALNIDCRFVTANMSSNDGELTLTILAAVAQEESANLSKRVKFGKKRNAAKGRVPNIVFGYDKTPGDYFNLAVNEAEARVVKRIFSYYVSRRYGANKIAQILNREGLLTKRKCRWSQQAVSTILTNPLYIGKIINGKESVKDFLTGERVKNPVDRQYIVDKPELAVIDEAVFCKAQILLAERTENFRLTKTRQSNKHIFSTLIKCGGCGYSFRRTYRKYAVKEYIRWCCSGRNANGLDFCRNHTNVDEAELLAAIKSYLSGMTAAQDKLLQQTVAELKKQYKPAEHELSGEFILEELSRLRKAKAKQTQMFERDIITLDELEARTLELNAAIAGYEKELGALRDNTASLGCLDEFVRQYCGSIQDILAADIIDNAALRRVVDKIVVTGEGEITVHIRLLADWDVSRAAAI